MNTLAEVDNEKTIENLKKEINRLEEENKKQAEEIIWKDKFFGIVAHDLRAPFVPILGLSEVLKRDFDSLDDQTRRFFIDKIFSYSENCFHLLGSILNWSQLQNGSFPFSPEVVDVNEVIKKVMTLFEQHIFEKEIKVNLTISKKLPVQVFADSNMLQSILRNLISNAIKFTKKGGELYLSYCRSGDKELALVVKDNGLGMSQKVFEKLFSPGEDICQPDADNKKGAGMGLLLCKEFVEKNGGRIWVESEEGEGTTFYFTVPLISFQ